MSSTLRVILIISLVLYFGVVLKLLKNKILSLKYSLLWLAMGGVFLVLILFPNVLLEIVKLFGITSAMNGLFTFAIAFILMLCMTLTAIVSKQTERIKTLIQECALLEKRIRNLEQVIKEE